MITLTPRSDPSRRGAECGRRAAGGMESGAEPRERCAGPVPEGGPIPSSQGGVIRYVGSTGSTVSPGGSTKPSEKKREHQPSRSSVVPTSQHRSSQSSSSGALDLQAVVGRPSSSISGVTVPIRLDALSYLLNNAVMGNNRMPSQMPYYPPAYPMCSYPQMGCPPYGLCMGSQYCSSAFTNQYPSYQAGFMPYGSQQSMQPCQQQVPNFNQCMSDTSQIQNKGPSSSFNPQSGMAFNPTETAFNSTGMTMNAAGPSSAQYGSATTQSNPSNWAKKPYEKAESSERFGNNERSGSNWSNSANSEKQGSPRRGFGRFGDRKNEDSWSNRQQSSSFGRGSSRGRGNFGGSSWRDNSKGQDKEWTFGDRSRDMDFGSKRRFGENTERFQERGSFSKRGRWPGGRGRGGESPDPWQQKNKEKDPPVWPSTADTPGSFGLETKPSVPSSGGDEDWETDYPGETTASKLDDASKKPDRQSPVPCSPKSTSEAVSESSQVLEVAEVFGASPETEEPPTDSSSGKGTAAIEPEAKAEEHDSTSSPVISADDQQNEEIYTFIVTVEGEDNKGVLVEVNGENL